MMMMMMMIRFYKNGYRLGCSNGEIEGRIEGFQLGLSSSYRIWEELSFYKSQLTFTLKFQNIQFQPSHSSSNSSSSSKSDLNTTRSSKLKTRLSLLFGLIEGFPKMNSKEEEIDLISKLNLIRSNYRLCCNLLNLKPRLQSDPSLGF
ncbi:hypothetical protein DFH28DRAFT_980450 [Melampsora americana]|nr:hypothetical protein DFH28DRAFT_980450 [Melampsora americana]